MPKPLITSLFLFLLCYGVSCTTESNKDIPSIKLSRKNFEEILSIDGTVEPVNTTRIVYNLNPPGTIIYIIEDGTFVEAGDTVCIMECPSLETQYDHFKTSLETTEATLNKVKSDLVIQYATLEAQVELNEAEALMSNKDSLELLYASPKDKRLIELRLEKLAIERKILNQKLEFLKIVQQTELRRWELQVERLRNNMLMFQSQLDGLIFCAPKRGVALRGKKNYPNTENLEIGETVYRNMNIISIPELDKMKTKITVSETDFKSININDSVVYSFQALPGNVGYGKILSKSPIGQEYRHGSKVKFFDIEASIDSVLTMPTPGLTANCNIVLKELQDTLVIPQITIFEEDSLKFVYVKRGRGYEQKQITTGLASTKEIVVTAGLQGNEEITILKPKSSRIKIKTLIPDTLSNTEKELITDLDSTQHNNHGNE